MQNLPLKKITAITFVLSAISFLMLDERFYHLVLTEDKGQRKLLKKLTYIGDAEWMLIGSLALYVIGLVMFKFIVKTEIWRTVSNKSLFVFAAVALPGIFASFTKNALGRARPKLFETEGPFGFDFLAFDSDYAGWPSGHTTTAFAMATAITLLFPRLAYITFPLAILAAYTRTALGAHYLADVIMGAAVGTVGAILVYRWLKPKLKL